MPTNYQELYKPTLSGQLGRTSPGWGFDPGLGGRFGKWGRGGFQPVLPTFKETPWEQHFTAEGVPLYQQTGERLSDLLDRQRRMQEVGGYTGGSLGAQIAELQKQRASQERAFQQFSTAHNLFPYMAHYTAEGQPIWQQTEQSLTDLMNRKNQLVAVGGYFGQLDAQIAKTQSDIAAQKEALNRAQAMYQAGGEAAWQRKLQAEYDEQRKRYYGDHEGGGNGGGGGSFGGFGMGSQSDDTGPSSYGEASEGDQE
ncbi:MAG: hypothetical protein GTN80_08190 [Nitrososphaeria archaeon]|nr:hypothetical protein [Nitrososphaeria archaeon]NIQ33602.1 hypothetical protein [Nitrososphaeria archaeon]